MDKQTERVNQVLGQYLHLYTDYKQKEWALLLPVAEFTYNNMPHSLCTPRRIVSSNYLNSSFFMGLFFGLKNKNLFIYFIYVFLHYLFINLY